MKILIVDDDFVCRSILLNTLASYGAIDVAVSANEAIEAFDAAQLIEKPYDLMFLDRIMPGGHGDLVLKHVRKFESDNNFDLKQSCTIIMVTSIDDPKEIFDAFKNQCEGYITKPVKPKKVMDTLNQCGVEL